MFFFPRCQLGVVAVSFLATAIPTTRAFQIGSPLTKRAHPFALASAVATPPSTAAPDGMVYDCDENGNFITVPLCNDEECRASLDVRIHGNWYDLSGWRKAHPSGSHWIDMYDGRDATEVMDAFHTKRGREMYSRLPKSDPKTVSMLSTTVPSDTDVQMAFRDLRAELESDGWWDRDLFVEAKLLAILGSLAVGAVLTAHDAPALSIMLTSLTFTNAGWIGHDYIHGVDKFCEKMRMLSPTVCGISPTWWSDKHNKHHAHTNQMGVDDDIAAGPLLYTYAPDPSRDSPFRRFQHYTFFLPFSLLFALWRVRSFQTVIQSIEEKRPQAKEELYSLLTHYFVVLTFLPTHVWVPAVFISGLMSAIIVTPTHQSDFFFNEKQEDWVSAQFTSTRNAVLTNPVSTWLWGGMQYQLEHHLFPSMPRAKYPELRPILKQFASEHGLTYLESGEFEILEMNWELYKEVAKADPVVGAPTMTFSSLEEKVSADLQSA